MHPNNSPLAGSRIVYEFTFRFVHAVRSRCDSDARSRGRCTSAVGHRSRDDGLENQGNHGDAGVAAARGKIREHLVLRGSKGLETGALHCPMVTKSEAAGFSLEFAARR